LCALHQREDLSETPAGARAADPPASPFFATVHRGVRPRRQTHCLPRGQHVDRAKGALRHNAVRRPASASVTTSRPPPIGVPLAVTRSLAFKQQNVAGLPATFCHLISSRRRGLAPFAGAVHILTPLRGSQRDLTPRRGRTPRRPVTSIGLTQGDQRPETCLGVSLRSSRFLSLSPAFFRGERRVLDHRALLTSGDAGALPCTLDRHVRVPP
jgi:hypothetical protein